LCELELNGDDTTTRPVYSQSHTDPAVAECYLFLGRISKT
jgi:hypothetical protein